MPAVKPSGASGVPDHLQAQGVVGIIPGVRPPMMPAQATDQMPPHYGGVELPLDPMLAAAGAYWNERRELVRKWRIHNGPPEEVRNAAGVVVRRVQQYWTRERHVAPPGMSIEDARVRGLDFYSPAYGWIRGGIKRETDDPANLGTGHLVGQIDIEEIEVAPNGAPLSEAVSS
jgi:hypothetical protein